MNSAEVPASHARSSSHQIDVQLPESGNVVAHENGRTPTPSNTKKQLRAPICVKLTLFICLCVMVASGVPELVLWKKVHQQLVGEIENRLMTVSTLRQEQLKDYLYNEADKIQLISVRIVINNYLNNVTAGNKTAAEADLRGAVSVISDFRQAAVYDDTGLLVLSTDEYVFKTQIAATYVNSIMRGTPKLELPVRTNEGWTYIISRGIFKSQARIGLLMVLVNATKLVSLVYDKTGLQETGELLIGVPDGHEKINLLLPAMRNPNVTTLPYGGAMAKAINGESGIVREQDYSGASVIAAYRPAGFLHWGLLAQMEINEAYGPVRNVRFVILVTFSVLLVVGILASLLLAKVFTSPIIELGKAAFNLGRGHMRTRVKKGSSFLQDEISNLKDTFNRMAHEIASHQYILEHKVRERTSDLAHANDGLAREIEERLKIESELEKAKDVAMAADRSKSEFLANMSHEIRTPLNAIINFTELCLDTQITPEQKEHLDYVRFAAQHLLRLITDILDFSKIEAGKLEIEEISFSLFEQIEQSLSVLAARAWKSGLELCSDFSPDVPDQLVGDPGRLLQIFVNLIGNGIKFTKRGEVVVSAFVKSKTAAVVELLFAVKDSGLGIPQSKQCLLFQAFSQLDSSTQRVYGGTGLGLAISSKLAMAMGGKMWVESEGIEGLGSTFWFSAKFKTCLSSNGSFSRDSYLFKGVSALVVDDNMTSLKTLVNLLKSWGITTHGVEQMEAAKRMLQNAKGNGQRYNVILLDMWLNGIEASKLVHYIQERPSLMEKYRAPQKLQKNQGLQSDGVEGPSSIVHHQEKIHGVKQDKNGEDIQYEVQDRLSNEDEQTIADNLGSRGASHSEETILSSIVMLTSVNHTDSIRCKELGILAHTSKPMKRTLLKMVLQSALGIQDKAFCNERDNVKEHKTSFKSLHVLIAEDNPVNQRVAIKLLDKWGHTTVLAGNGAEAVEQAAKQEFDVILMDVQMPVCDGFEATAKIRKNERAENKRSTPIVAMTAHAMMGDGEFCIAAGMDYYITKPLNSKKLQELLQYVATSSINAYTDTGAAAAAASAQ